MTAATLAVAGCSLINPSAVPSEPFSDFSVGEFGDIDGRQNILYVRADGVALLISRMPASGRLSEQALQRLQTDPSCMSFPSSSATRCGCSSPE
jgi:hypothetical protein